MSLCAQQKLLYCEIFVKFNNASIVIHLKNVNKCSNTIIPEIRAVFSIIDRDLMLKKHENCCLNVFVETLIHCHRLIWWIESPKETWLISCNFLNVFITEQCISIIYTFSIPFQTEPWVWLQRGRDLRELSGWWTRFLQLAKIKGLLSLMYLGVVLPNYTNLFLLRKYFHISSLGLK